MEARNKTIESWFSMVEQGHVVLPRFQRHEAWGRGQIAGLLENIVRKPALPMGTLLVLEIGDEEPFHSRPIVGAPPPTGGKPMMHLLDGQQRMTALWRSLTDNYEDLTLFISLESAADTNSPDEQGDSDEPEVVPVKRWDRKGVLQPVWADDPAQQFERGCFPAAVLCPGSRGEKALKAWMASVGESGADINAYLPRLYELRGRVANYTIPFLALGAETGRETALDVFIRMNTSASPLKDFDIVVAQLEEATGQSLHEMLDELLEEAPQAKAYGKVEDIVLSVAALLMGRPPLKKTYLEKSFGKGLRGVWPDVQRGFSRGLAFLHREAMFNERCLPTDVAVYLTCALWARAPEQGFDAEGNARTLIRKALWRACYTDRYGKTSATRAYADFSRLADALRDENGSPECDLFDEEIYPLADVSQLVSAGWPGRKDRLPRAILATTLRAGGVDFADGDGIGPENISRREYHHLYPVAVLGGDRSDAFVNRALNCALISWRTNRKVAAKTPAEYIQARAEAADLGDDEVRQRLESHLVPYNELIAGDYDAFVKARAVLVESHMRDLCAGRNPRVAA
ncbi:GmrSD restriction endonuclease domain-containing protein [Pyruvatibacter mobilis]|uniref:GmrSD restriction endonuclease domain-containing protein n=1 Tax=Pyruvatibacter mobilis TaxID=1712261 RepID=UPI003BAF59E3